MDFSIRPLDSGDSAWVSNFLAERWGSGKIVSRGKVYDAGQLPGFVAIERAGEPVGLVTYRIEGDECEIITLDSTIRGEGIGTGLIEAVKGVSAVSGCRRLWLITTNDNTAALRFYQKMGFLLVALHRNALVNSRRLKPEIPFIGIDGIPLRDEIELEMPLDQDDTSGG